MQLTVIFDIEARAGLKVGQIFGVGQIKSELAANPFANTRRRGNQIDPDRLDFGEIKLAFDDDLTQTSIVQFEGIDDDFFARSMSVADQHFLHFVGEQFQDVVLTLFAVPSLMKTLRPARKSALLMLRVLATKAATSTLPPGPTMMPAGFTNQTRPLELRVP